MSFPVARRGSCNILREAYSIRIQADPGALDAGQWNRLLALQATATPFMRHEYLDALQASGSAVPETGWAAQFVTVHSADGELQAAAALYLKGHSYGEYVFDWAWADAYRRHGLRYYPKLLGAVPFTPVPGSRLLASSAAWRDRLMQAIERLLEAGKLSSGHVLFIDPPDEAAFRRAGWMIRHGVQFHWTQDADRPMVDFADLLTRLQRDKRKKIQQERRRIGEQGVTFSVLAGRQIEPAHWNFFYRCYTLTYAAHHSTPYLTRDFFARMARPVVVDQ
jgi:predicted N-acyltransferase